MLETSIKDYGQSLSYYQKDNHDLKNEIKAQNGLIEKLLN